MDSIPVLGEAAESLYLTNGEFSEGLPFPEGAGVAWSFKRNVLTSVFAGSACYFVFQQVDFHEVKTTLGRVTNPSATEATSKAWRVTKLHRHRIKYSKRIIKALLGSGALHPDPCSFLSVPVLESQYCIATLFCCCSPEQHSVKFVCSKLIVYYLVAAGHILTKVTNHVIFPRTEERPRVRVFTF